MWMAVVKDHSNYIDYYIVRLGIAISYVAASQSNTFFKYCFDPCLPFMR